MAVMVEVVLLVLLAAVAAVALETMLTQGKAALVLMAVAMVVRITPTHLLLHQQQTEPLEQVAAVVVPIKLVHLQAVMVAAEQ
jgi:hypothetical protein